MPRHFLCFLLLLWGFRTEALASRPLPGFTYMTPSGQNVRWEKFPIKLCLSREIPAVVLSQAQEAARIWNEALSRKIFDLECSLGKQEFSEQDTTQKGIYWISRDFGKYTDKTSVARTLVSFEDSGKMIDADILLNGQYYDWSRSSIDPVTLLVHELGHVLGLKHLFISLDSAMNHFPYASGYVHRRLGEYEIQVFQALYQGKPVQPPKHVEHYFAGRPAQAIRELKKKPSKSVSDLYALAVLYKESKKLKLARKSLEQALRLEPKRAFIRLQYAEALWSLKDLKGAEKEFLHVIQEEPKNYEAHANLGSLYLDQGDSRKGAEYLKKSLSLQPAHWAACELLYLLTKEDQYKECVQKYGPEKNQL